MPTAETMERFIARIEQGAHAEAIEEFYSEDGSTRENQAPVRATPCAASPDLHLNRLLHLRPKGNLYFGQTGDICTLG